MHICITRLLLPLIFVGLAALPATAAREATWVSYPALGPDGSVIYFTAYGDIWSAPVDGSHQAHRLTDNVAYDGRPTLSPDGRQIAFLSDRYGNYDLFVMPADGGEAKRLTWNSDIDYIYDWKPDGSAVLEYGLRQDLWGNSLYEVTLDGSQPRRISGPDHDDHVFGSYLGSATDLVYTRGPGDWARKHYRGQGNYDLWRFNAATGEHTQLTDFNGMDMWPQPSPDGSKVYYTSDADGTDNLWVLDLGNGNKQQLTSFVSDGPRWPRISASGNRIVFTVFGEPWVMDLPAGNPRRVEISFAGDPKHVTELSVDRSGDISEYALSPNGKYFAFINMGDVYVLKNPDSYPEDAKPDQDLSRAFRLTNTTQREMQLDWAPDSTELAYVSDRDGQFEVYLADLATRQERRLTASPQDEWWPDYSPDDQHIAFYCGNRCLKVQHRESGASFEIANGRLRNGPFAIGYKWSPDGKWIAYGVSVLDYIPNIYLVNIDAREPVNITRSPDWAADMSWSPDGKYLAWSQSGENSDEVMLLELSPKEKVYDTDILFPEDMPGAEDATGNADGGGAGTPAASAESAEASDSADPSTATEEATADGSEPPASQDEEPKLPEVKIDLDRIHLRAQVLSTMHGSAHSPRFDPTGKFLLFRTDHGGDEQFWTVSVDGEEYTQVGDAEGREIPEWSPDGKKLYTLQGGNISYIEMNGAAPAGGGGHVPTTARVDLNQYATWDQMLQEGWRHLRDGFYDPQMHGVDWNAVLARYRPRIQELGTGDEFGQLMREMLGELGASHLGFYSSAPTFEAASDVTADFGVDWDEGHLSEGWRVAKVIADGPADQHGSELYEGDIVLSVNGASVNAADNRARILRNLNDQPVVLVVRSSAAALDAIAAEEARIAELTKAGGADAEKDEAAEANTQTAGLPAGQRRVVIAPVSPGEMGQLRYEQWVMGNRAKVERSANGEIGYLHIQSMNGSSLEKFRRELFGENLTRRALIIDVRFNGGGNIHEQLVDLLDRRSFGYAQYRDDTRWTHPAQRWEGPIVVLINASSFSDAEIFPHIMQKLGLATIIGEPTGGNVIGTYNFELMDGSTFRLPNRGWWLLDETNMEGFGAQPDVFVHIDPETVAAGGDNQLDTAVEFLAKELGEG